MRFLNSVKSLYAAVGILFLSFGVGMYVDLENETMHARHLEINIGLERMVRLNQELTSMLVVAVLKNSALGTASYATVKADLSQTMDHVAALTQSRESMQDVLALIDALNQLRAFEERAMELIADEKWAAAAEILLGDAYVLAKKTYEVDSETAVGAVTGGLAATAARFERIRLAALGLRLAALFLLLWVGVMFSRRSRADLEKQIRLHDEIGAAYADMEARVRERTADLEQTTQHLAFENAAREQSERRTRLILNSAGEGIFGVDAAGLGVFFNDASARLLGYPAEELIGADVRALIHGRRADGSALPPEACPMHRACADGLSRTAANEVFWRKDGTAFPCEYAATPLGEAEGANAGAVVVFRDVTERRESQEELRRRMDELERFNRLTMGREERMIRLKQEVDALRMAQGLPKRYRDIDGDEILSAAASQRTGGER